MEGDLSVIQRAMGADFDRLHPRIRTQYALHPDNSHFWRGEGTMHVIRCGGPHVAPFAILGGQRRILFAETGRDVPFIVENHAYVDSYGRSTITWLREFAFEHPRRFDEYLIYSEKRRSAVVLAGTRQHLAVDLVFGVGPNGSLRIRTAAQRVRAWGLTVGFPRLLSGDAEIEERFNDERDQFEIDVIIKSPIVGLLFEYRGAFQLQTKQSGSHGLSSVRPFRENPCE